ncbi:hypothetical protein V6N11_008961 [Hibiscus sabdariffa]|uniref:Uncharacterized protein n=1 Tax=Hibiscus sabdariffa TaxID=183260 RepID=A0ABR2PPX9_9ROSI
MCLSSITSFFIQVPQPETACIDIEHQPVQPPSQPQSPSQLEPTVAKCNCGILLFICTRCIPPILFIFILLAFFIHPKCIMILQALQKAALLLAATAFCHALSIPFSTEIKCAVWALFFLSLLGAMIFTYLNIKKA